MALKTARTYTTTEVAEVLGLSRATVQKLVRDGKIRTLDLGVRKILVSEAELKRVLGDT